MTAVWHEVPTLPVAASQAPHLLGRQALVASTTTAHLAEVRDAPGNAPVGSAPAND